MGDLFRGIQKLFGYSPVEKKQVYYVFDKDDDFLSEDWRYPFYNLNSAKRYAKKLTLKERQSHAVVNDSGKMILFYNPPR